MTCLEKRSHRYRVIFRFAGRRFTRSLRTRDERTAQASLARLEDNLRRVELGTLEVPDGADAATFLLSDGQRSKPAAPLPPAKPRLTLCGLFAEYLDSLPVGSLECTTLGLIKMHRRHLERLLGAKCRVDDLSMRKLQQYVQRRSCAKGLYGRPLSGTTIRKEIGTLRTVWNWALAAELVSVPFPGRRLKYPKDSERPPFRTWQEIERQIKEGHLDAQRQRELWDCLFLSVEEIADLLAYVKETARHPFIYPMFCFAAHTGARRSEIVRSRRGDVDFGAGFVTIRERKRSQQRSTFRRVPLSAFLRSVLVSWFAEHPGGEHTFCHGLDVPHSKTKRDAPGAITRDEANDHLKRTLKRSKWQVLRGWHLLRHSFCSNCAAKGVDQRLINEWVGHQTEQMVRRYRHLFPDQQRRALETVFGNGQQSLVLDAQ